MTEEKKQDKPQTPRERADAIADRLGGLKHRSNMHFELADVEKEIRALAEALEPQESKP